LAGSPVAQADTPSAAAPSSAAAASLWIRMLHLDSENRLFVREVIAL
jgi:hypothetical protein